DDYEKRRASRASQGTTRYPSPFRAARQDLKTDAHLPFDSPIVLTHSIAVTPSWLHLPTGNSAIQDYESQLSSLEGDLPWITGLTSFEAAAPQTTIFYS
ncbi:MAG TPA: hypothetical protein VEM27_15380, partial [Gemmatimonadales bacterium]|nr:hypothetical protein [Gemmatimonadales bacterium]